MVSSGTRDPHQLRGNEDSHFGHTEFPRGSSECLSAIGSRQLNSSGVYQQSGRDSVKKFSATKIKKDFSMPAP